MHLRSSPLLSSFLPLLAGLLLAPSPGLAGPADPGGPSALSALGAWLHLPASLALGPLVLPMGVVVAMLAWLLAQWLARRNERRTGQAVDALLWQSRSEEHTSELQSQSNLVCRLLLEKKKYSAFFCLWILTAAFLPATTTHFTVSPSAAAHLTGDVVLLVRKVDPFVWQVIPHPIVLWS